MKKLILVIVLLTPAIIRGYPLPRFNYIDVDLFSATLVDHYDFHSGINLDIFNGKILFHSSFTGGYGPLNFLGVEFGLGFALQQSRYIQDQPVSRIINMQSRTTYYGEEITYTYEKLHCPIFRLKLWELGLEGLLWSELNTKSDWNPIVFGQTFNSITEIDFHANDIILYFGYKVMNIPKLVLTSSEWIFYIHGLLGYTIRQADLWDNSYNSFPAYTINRDPAIAVGAEVNFSYYLIRFRAGVYDGHPFFSAGFRLPLTWGMKIVPGNR